jgi:hypothetical protein
MDERASDDATGSVGIFLSGPRHGDELARKFYVYAHVDTAGSVFYIGKGTGRRAWSPKRHLVWEKYVAERLGGRYEVKILHNGLTQDEAEAVEWELIDELGPQLVNWVNYGRQFDYPANEKYWKDKKANQQFVAATRRIERTDLGRAIVRYKTAMAKMYEYEAIVRERGLVADLMEGEYTGDLNLLHRLTVCLVKAGEWQELIATSDEYFSRFPAAVETVAGKDASRRVDKARRKLAAQG